jgi:diacylglycerol kinase (ATP)
MVVHNPVVRVVILTNPASGRGTAERAAVRAQRRLEAVGIEVVSAPTPADDTAVDDLPDLEGVTALVVAGGDGAVRSSATAAMRSGTPLWHLPCGTANLFARALGMSRDPDELLAALRAGNVRRLDTAKANGETSVLMASVGYDAEIVHDLTARRGAAISNLSYLGPMVRQLMRWRPPALSITLDGKTLVSGQRGMVVAANCPLYMWGLNPAAEAVMDDGLLDVVFFPVEGRGDLLGWMIKCTRHRQRRDPRFVAGRGRWVEITLPEPQLYQLDGDPPSRAEGPAGRLEVEVREASLPVLSPA